MLKRLDFSYFHWWSLKTDVWLQSMSLCFRWDSRFSFCLLPNIWTFLLFWSFGVCLYIYRYVPLLKGLLQITSNWKDFLGEWIIENWQLKILNNQKIASVVRMNDLDSFCFCRGIHTSVVFASIPALGLSCRLCAGILTHSSWHGCHKVGSN